MYKDRFIWLLCYNRKHVNQSKELLAIDQAIECLVSYFLKLPEVENYRLKRQKFENDRELQEQLFAFQELKDSYDTAKAYEAFRPDVRELKRQVLRMKRQIDLNEVVIGLSSGRVRFTDYFSQSW